MSREIQLTQGKVAIVDDEDYARLSQFSWHAYQHRHTWYAKHSQYRPGKSPKTIYMAAEILGVDALTDHINGNGLDNRRCNLRAATNSQNAANTRLRSTNISGHANIRFRRTRPNSKGSWHVAISCRGRSYQKQGFASLEDAIEFRDLLAVELHGEFAAHLGVRI